MYIYRGRPLRAAPNLVGPTSLTSHPRPGQHSRAEPNGAGGADRPNCPLAVGRGLHRTSSTSTPS
jgi:hypothetical protein